MPIFLWADRKFELSNRRVFALYVASYALGRFFIEFMRTDAATIVLGLRINTITSAALLLGGIVAFFLMKRQRETKV